MQRKWLAVGLVTATLTAAGETLVWGTSYLPAGYSAESEISDDAFRLLFGLGVPVFAFIVAMLVVSAVCFRSSGPDRGDGPPARGNRRVYVTWLGVTSALAVGILVNPGFVGLHELRGSKHADLIVKVNGARWYWSVTYPGSDITTTTELVLPTDTRVRFEVTSADVLHSFWVPAFRAKIDAVPGRTTVVYTSTEGLGSRDSDPGLRLQCAELCGLAHASMAMPVRLVDRATFDAWIAEQRSAGSAGETASCKSSGTALQLVADKVAFDRHCLAVPADVPFSIQLENRESVPHNIAIFGGAEGDELLFRGDVFTGPATQTVSVPKLEPGRYLFRCDLHPIPAMSGSLVVEARGEHDESEDESALHSPGKS